MYLARKVRGHVYVLAISICVKDINMYLARKVRGDVFVPCQESEGSCICAMPLNTYT
jgi:hypothetical protein